MMVILTAFALLLAAVSVIVRPSPVGG